VSVYGEEPVIRGGCATGGSTGRGLILLAAVLIFVRRQRY
jgi:MYXO-CTERM domain-containing protein